jgi:predicted nucleic acid-binding protein
VRDTNLLVSGLIVPHGLPHRLIAEWRQGIFRLLVTDAILAEYAAVLGRPRFAEKNGLTPAVVD